MSTRQLFILGLCFFQFFMFLEAASPGVAQQDWGENTEKVFLAPAPPTRVNAVVTCYNPIPGQTDDTPFITASGEKVFDGVVANNVLPFGAQVRIPKLFGGKVFVVADRMHERFSGNRFDVLFLDQTVHRCKKFGVRRTVVEILDEEYETLVLDKVAPKKM